MHSILYGNVAAAFPKTASIALQRQHVAAATRSPALILSRRLSRSTASSGASPRTPTLRLSSASNKKSSVTPTSLSSSSSSKQQSLHSSAKTNQPTPTLSMEQEGISKATTTAGSNGSTTTISSADIPRPTMQQLKVLFAASAVPMVGFGFMDNIVMIQAGSYIDNTLGVTMGLATMTAAAAGQVVSDVSGVIFGGSLERFLHRYKLIQASTLTAAQRSLPLCRNVALFGAVCGVALGCGLGASCLLFMDLEARERAERALQLQAVLNDMMMEASEAAAENDNNDDTNCGALACESCIIHLAHLPAAEHFATEHKKLQDAKSKTKIDFLPSAQQLKEQSAQEKTNMSLALRAAHSRKSMLNENGTVLCTPILAKDEDGKVEGEALAVLEFHMPKDTGRRFTPRDERNAKVMARHIAIFMHRLSD